MSLTPQELAFVKDLNRNPMFASIAHKAKQRCRIPKWKRGGEEKEKTELWIFESGVGEGVNYVLQLLGYDHE